MNAMSAQSNAPYKVLGTRPIRHDGLDKVTGQAKYGADVNMPWPPVRRHRFLSR